MARHLVWDWNGTLLDDVAAVVAATNHAFGTVAGPVIDLDGFRRTFRRPIRDMYAELLGRPVDAAEFGKLDRVFHEHYRTGVTIATLAAGAAAALASWPGTQSLLSMWFHDELVDLVARLDLARHFGRVDGLRLTVGGGGKAEHLYRHLEALGRTGADCVMIGDSLDDAVAAEAAGARCVLYTGGVTDPDRLHATGHPVATTLPEAVTLATLR